MIYFASEALGNSYYSNKLSRAFCVSALIYLFAMVAPVLIVASIGAGWPQYSISTDQPRLTYSDYQITCVDSSYNNFYASSFESESHLSTTSVSTSLVSTGSSDTISQYTISVVVSQANLRSCSLMLYFNTTLSSKTNAQFVGYLPVSASADSSYFLSSSQITAKSTLQNLNPLAQSYSLNTQYLTSFTEPSSTFAMWRNLLNSGLNNLTLNTQILSQFTAVSSQTTASTLTINLAVPSQRVLVQNSLLTQMREFWRNYVYILIPLWTASVWLVRWMLKNRIYATRTFPNSKLKLQ